MKENISDNSIYILIEFYNNRKIVIMKFKNSTCCIYFYINNIYLNLLNNNKNIILPDYEILNLEGYEKLKIYEELLIERMTPKEYKDMTDKKNFLFFDYSDIDIEELKEFLKTYKNLFINKCY